MSEAKNQDYSKAIAEAVEAAKGSDILKTERQGGHSAESFLKVRLSDRTVQARNCSVEERLMLCERLVEKAFRLRTSDTRKMIEAAQAAVDVAQELRWVGEYEEICADACAAAWLVLANSNRITGNLLRARDLIGDCHYFLERGTQDPLLENRFIGIYCLIKAHIGDFSSARQMAFQGMDLSKRFGSANTLADSHLRLASLEYHCGSEPGRALAHAVSAVHTFGPDAESVKVLGATASVAQCLLGLGAPSQAQAVLQPVLELASHPSLVILRTKAKALSSIADFKMGKLSQGLHGINEAKVGLRSLGHRADAACLDLRLAQCHAELGDWFRARQAAERAETELRAVDAGAKSEIAAGLVDRAAFETGREN